MSIKNKSIAVKDPPSIIPDIIRVIDGRQFDVHTLLKRCGPSEYYNLRSRKPSEARHHIRAAPKYTIDERLWMASATYDQIIQRYSVSEAYAKILRWQGRKIQYGFPTRSD